MLGMLAIPLWATWPALALQMRELPALECVSLGFLVGWAVLRWMQPKTEVAAPTGWLPWIPAIAFALGECGSAAFFVMATQRISAAEANLIMYLWPGEIVALGAVLGIFRLSLRPIVGLLLAFAGAVALLRGGSLSLSYGGIGLAFLAGISWALYCIFRLKWRGPAPMFLAQIGRAHV